MISTVHKFGIALTIVLAIVGFWDVKAMWEHEALGSVGGPLMGIAFFLGFMKLALDR